MVPQVQILHPPPLYMAVVAKRLRHKIVNLGIASSNLVYRPIYFYAVVAQLVERHPSKLDVAGSSPVCRTNFLIERLEMVEGVNPSHPWRETVNLFKSTAGPKRVPSV